MQLDNALGTRAKVETIDILGDQAADHTRELEFGDGEVPGVRLSAGKALPAAVAARPEALAVVEVTQKLLEGHRGASGCAIATVVRDPGISADTGSSEHRNLPTGEELNCRIECCCMPSHMHRRDRSCGHPTLPLARVVLIVNTPVCRNVSDCWQ